MPRRKPTEQVGEENYWALLFHPLKVKMDGFVPWQKHICSLFDLLYEGHES